MSNLKETIEAQCPTFYALHHVERFFTVARRDRVPGTLTLRLDLSSLKLPGSSQASHTVKVKHEIAGEEGARRLVLAWDPRDQSVPRFEGTLSCAPAEPGKTIITLEGTYTPPLGVAGKAFDLVVGNKIAAATAQALLADIKAFVESDYQTAAATNLASSPKD
jgi:hypothetical protein